MKVFCSLTVYALVAAGPLAGAAEKNEVDLTVFDAIRLALENNLQLQVEELSPQIAADQVTQARGEFDPIFSVEVRHEELERRQNVLEFLSTNQLNPQSRLFEEESTLFRTGVAKKNSLGTVFDLSTRLRRIENTVVRESQYAIWRPEYESFSGLQVTQPLLRGYGRETNLAGIRAARIGLTIAEEEREIAVINKVSEVVNAYYDMVFGQENLRVKEETLGVAEQLLSENQRRLELGRMAPIDVAEARVSVSEREEEVIAARDFLRERELLLRSLIHAAPDWSRTSRYRASAALPETVPAVEAAAELYPVALERRPDFRLAEAQFQRNRLRETFANNQVLPRLDLKFSYGLTGLHDNAGESYDRVLGGHEPHWSVGFVFSVPIGNQEGKAQAAAARRQGRQSELEIKKLEHEISIEIQNAVARLEMVGQRLETAGVSRQLAEEALRIEETRLEAGRTTSYRVSELQGIAADARTREVAARVDAQKAVVHVWAVTGRLLDEHGFLLEDTPAASRLEPQKPSYLTPDRSQN